MTHLPSYLSTLLSIKELLTSLGVPGNDEVAEFNCKICDWKTKVFKSESALSSHVRGLHHINLADHPMDYIVNLGLSAFAGAGKKGGFQCVFCDKKNKLFKSELAMSAHLKDYHKIHIEVVDEAV